MVILAGGAGSRIGGGKPKTVLGGRTLFERAATRAAAWSKLAAVAVRGDGQVPPTSLPIIDDDPAVEGPLGGLVAALEWARNRDLDALLTIPCDMPFLPSDLASRLLQSLGDARAAIAASGGNLHPVCGLWRTEVLELVPAYLASGRRSLKGLAEEADHVAVDWPVASGDPFFNINSPEDLAAAEKLLRG